MEAVPSVIDNAAPISRLLLPTISCSTSNSRLVKSELLSRSANFSATWWGYTFSLVYYADGIKQFLGSGVSLSK